MKQLLWFLIGLMMLGNSGCGQIENETPKERQQIQKEVAIREPVSPVDPSIELSIEEKIGNYVKSMSTHEKIGQLLMPAFRTFQYEEVESFTDEMQKILKEYQVGGIILFGENIKTPDQLKLLIKDLQSHSRIPLWIGVDEEGGLVSRIAANPDMGFDPIDNAFDIGKTGDPQKAYDMGRQLGEMLRQFGFNINFAPVADIWSNPNNTVIGKRSFGQEAQIVSLMVTEVMSGLKEEKIVPVIKHFPGHGDTKEDTHDGRAYVDRSLEELLQRELIPFKNAIDDGVDVVMVGHLELPQIHPEIPASLSPKIIRDLLKRQMGFEGLVITDALDMKALTNQFGEGEIALQSFLAGTDILLMPNIEEAYLALLNACEQGLISKERLDESVYKILQTKYKYGILKEDFFQ